MSLFSRTKVHDQPSGQVLVRYSDERKNEMNSYGDNHCSALSTLMRIELEKMGIKVLKITPSERKNRFADLIIEFKIRNHADISSIKQTIESLKDQNVGIGQADVYIVKE